MKKLKGDSVIGLFTALLGFGTVIYTLLEPKMTFAAQTSDGVPGAGFFPIILGAILGCLGVVLFFVGLKPGKDEDQSKNAEAEKELKLNRKQLLLSIAAIAAFFILWQVTGIFIVWSAALVFTLNVIFERKLKYNIIYTLVFIAFIYLAFIVGFKINFNL